MTATPPQNMQSGPVRLEFERLVKFKPGGELVPYYHFKIQTRSSTGVGHINFRVGDTSHVVKCAGHIGYKVLPEHRGHSYSYFACEALRPFLKQFYTKIILTADPKNGASIKIFQKLGATFLNEITVPVHDPAYKNGARIKQRYGWEI